MGVLYATDQFSLKDTLESGQLFRAEPHGHGYYVQNGKKSFYVEQRDRTLKFDGITQDDLVTFFDLKRDYSSIRRTLVIDLKLVPAINAHPGIRLVNQDLWECMVGFVASSNNKISKIMRSMHFLSDLYGPRRGFPRPEHLRELPDRACGLGYRAEYVREMSKLVDERYLRELKTLPYVQAKERLEQLPGIGAKVADCVCLFALRHPEAFPVDTHIEHVMGDLYGLDKKAIREFATQHWGKHAGYAQQFLFHWKRVG